MPYCGKCGTLVKEDDQFCNKCGSALNRQITLTCKKCGSTLKVGDKFCGKCGHPNENTNNQYTGHAHKLTNLCLNCGVVLADNIINCNKCGYHVETVKCPECGKATNPMEAQCNNCNSNIADLVKADMDRSSSVLRVLLESDSFKEIWPKDQVLRLARQNSIVGLAMVFAYETVAKQVGSYKKRFSLFVYDEASPDEWDNPNSLFNPRDRYASKQEYIEAIRKDSKRPDFGLFAWAITYARYGKDIYAYRLCILLSHLYTTLGDLFDTHGFIISECGVELQKQAYELLNAAQKNPGLDYSKDDFAKSLFANVRYKMARQYFYIEYLELNEKDKDKDVFTYYMLYPDGFDRAFNMIQIPLQEDRTNAKLLRGLMNFNSGNNQLFIGAWNAACNDADYLNSKMDVMDEGIFTKSAIFMSRIAMRDGNNNAAISMLKFAYTYITRKIWADELQEEFSKYQHDSHGNIVYVE